MFHRACLALFAATLIVASPASALVYVNTIAVDDVTLKIRIETNGKVGLIAASDIVSFDASVDYGNGQSFTYDTTTDFTYTFTDGLFRATQSSFDLNGGYLASEQQDIDDRVVATIGIGGARYDQSADQYFDDEYYLAWGRPGYQDGRIVRIPYGQFNQTIAFVGDQVDGVPEPATWGMIVGGFGMLGAAMRRTRKAATAFA